ncbi:hypothetical protein [Oceanicoccus sp. KOV_DT_Chl]|uniref:hypothetical protein n=1 Tax=Oceanicoccus sp. KOV_DT_Chl TaxID=1904639 RepID=UPI001F28ED70|nr:hypothetical protein [Oceanicoccus sp. KOV_DT_Chl]
MANIAASYNAIDIQELSHDRLGFTFCLALALHAALILGITFSQTERTVAAPKLEITLAQHRSQQAPDEADFLAQHNQQGSGTLEEKAMLTTKELADFQDTQIQDVAKQQQSSQSQAQQAITTQLTSSLSDQQTQQQIEQNFERDQDQARTMNSRFNNAVVKSPVCKRSWTFRNMPMRSARVYIALHPLLPSNRMMPCTYTTGAPRWKRLAINITPARLKVSNYTGI